MSAFASFMLIAWVPITALIFARMAPAKAMVVSILYGYLFLPEGVELNLPVLATLDKTSIPALSSLLFYWLAIKREARQARLSERRGLVKPAPVAAPREISRATKLTNLIVIVVIAATFLTFMANRVPEYVGPKFLRGMTLYDTLSYIQTTLLMFLPLFLARHALGTREMMVFLLKTLVVAGLIYSLLMLFEVRMSPQLNKWTYGFFAHSWRQHLRGGHFRPIVFLEHGLRVGIFIAICTLAAATLFRYESDRKKRLRWLLAVVWFLPVLFLSRNTGATALAVVFAPIILVAGARLQIWLAAAIAATVLVYPLARGVGVIPTDTIVAQFDKISPDRARSFAFRLENEEILLERANQKPITGWGMFGRNRVFDPKTGESLSVTDGTWIIVIGIRGWIGYLGLFAILCLPPILLALRRDDQLTLLETGLALMLAINLIDLIPNSSMVSHIWLMAGALWGRLGWRALESETDLMPRKHTRHVSKRRGQPAGLHATSRAAS